MTSDSVPAPDAGAQRPQRTDPVRDDERPEGWDETVFGTPARPWDQPQQTSGGNPKDLRPHHHIGGVHPGWASAPQDAYDTAASGGWGVPGQILTGPIPKIRREQPDRSADETPGQDV